MIMLEVKVCVQDRDRAERKCKGGEVRGNGTGWVERAVFLDVKKNDETGQRTQRGVPFNIGLVARQHSKGEIDDLFANVGGVAERSHYGQAVRALVLR